MTRERCKINTERITEWRNGDKTLKVRHLVVEVEDAEAAGMTSPEAIADHFNAKGVTTRKGRRWTGAIVAKFLSSPGAERYRSGGKADAHGDAERYPTCPQTRSTKHELRRISRNNHRPL